jgi:hypothetical protein
MKSPRACKESLSSDESESQVSTIVRQRKLRRRKLGLSTLSLMNPSQTTPRLQQPNPSPSKIDFEIAKSEFVMREMKTNNIGANHVEPEEVVVVTSPSRKMTVSTSSIIETGYFQLSSPPKVISDEQFYEQFKNQYIANGEEKRLRRSRRVRMCIDR